MKGAIYLLIFSFIFTSGYAQDIISKKNGQIIRSKVLQVSPSDISYKLANDLNGTTFTILKDEVLSISYENGTTTNFVESTSSRAITYNYVPAKSSLKDGFKLGDVVIFKNENGKYRTGTIVGMKSDSVIVRKGTKSFALGYEEIAKHVE